MKNSQTLFISMRHFNMFVVSSCFGLTARNITFCVYYPPMLLTDLADQ